MTPAFSVVPIPESIWPSLVTAFATLAGVSLTLRLSNKNQVAAREHERAMARENREHEREFAALEHRQQVYESFLAAVDATQHAVAVMCAARQVGKDADGDATIVQAVTSSTNELYRAHSLLDLYASPDVAQAGITLFVQALDVQSAYQNYRQWQSDLSRFRDQFAVVIRSDIGLLIGAAPSYAKHLEPSESARPAPTNKRPNER